MIFDRKKGCFYGLAIGDALGSAVEFMEAGTFDPVTGYRGFGPHGLEAGQWTDDTSMALALADSLAKGWDTKDQLQNYLEWMLNGKYSVNGILFDIGTTTRSAILEFERKGTLKNNPDLADSGNGSIMRLAPLAIYYAQRPILELCHKARLSSTTTHSSEFCVDSCVYLAVILAALIKGEGKEVLTRQWWDAKQIPLNKHVLEIIENDDNPVGSGFVIRSLHAALWSFRHANSFQDAVLTAVNLGDDADTTGAVCGQLAGAYWGFNGIPQSLIDGLDKKEMIDMYLNPILGDKND